jgi:FKBP-type peptidyl-prolyl cis-trans isomerase (trigger factor)
MAAKKLASTKESNPTVARTDDGTVQITFVMPWAEVSVARQKAAEELSKETNIAGFRKGFAPLDKVIAAIPEQKLIEQTLTRILPDRLAKVIEKDGIRPAIYPRFELVKTAENEDWEVRAVTAEIPEIDLSTYKEKLIGEMRASALWKPGDDKKELSLEEKQDRVLLSLIKSVDVKVPALIIKEEADGRISQLLHRIEKLGLSLDAYLQSIGKTPETLRAEYASEAKSAIALDIILSRIADKEGLSVTDSEIDAALSASQATAPTGQENDSREQRNMVRIVLTKRKAVEYLTSLFPTS